MGNLVSDLDARDERTSVGQARGRDAYRGVERMRRALLGCNVYDSLLTSIYKFKSLVNTHVSHQSHQKGGKNMDGYRDLSPAISIPPSLARKVAYSNIKSI